MTAPADVSQHKSVALMFPGQGSQFPGMALDLVQESPKAQSILERADNILGYALSEIMAGKRGDELNRTVHTQPAIFVHSMALLEVLRDHFLLTPVVAAGHSLGEYSALCAAGVLTFDEALRIIHVRAKGMDEAQPPGMCGMAALVGLNREQATAIVEKCRGDDVLDAANFNSPDQVVISGHLQAVNRAVEAVKQEKRTRAVLLPVSSAFHTILMEPARQALRSKLEALVPREPMFPVVANVNAQTYPVSRGAVNQLLMDQIVRPVLWEDCVSLMRSKGAETFIEIGPGKVLTGLLKRIDKTAASVNISDMQSIRSFVGASA
ncbi:MAG: ACP S-malonyltransferase [Desulfomonile tiedjei]|nr:ACP S-malonyltransferase [Desulfomonile tiedjei]